jgi:5'-deoxynucleotidase YfbR-like HD superfamily hydrolase
MKHSLYPLNVNNDYAYLVQEIIEKLWQIPRTGWKDRKVKNPETVGEHTDEVVALARDHFHIPLLTTMLRVHDWAESDKKVGDIRTDPFCPPEKRWTKEKKYEVELDAMATLCSNLGPYGPMYFHLWLEFEERKTQRAKIAFQIDKFQPIIRAIKYQKDGQPVIAQEFIDHDGPKIIDHFLRKRMDRAIAELR